ncbi:hypothetical protein BH23THE1_BH23THE1_17280 [soil metagenome]
MKKSRHNENKNITEILYGIDSAVGRGIHLLQNTRQNAHIFGDKNSPSIIIEFEVFRSNFISLIKSGKTIKFITEITKDNLEYCKALMGIVTQLRHLDGLRGGIALNESEYVSTTTLNEKELLTVIFYSNEEEVAQFGHYIYDTLWEKAIPAKTRIREIEENTKREIIKVIQDPEEANQLFLNLVKQADEEIHILFPSYKIIEWYQRNGTLNTLVEKSNGLEVRVLVKEDLKLPPSQQNDRLYDNNQVFDHSKIQLLTTSLIESKIMVIIVDKEESLSMEIRDKKEEEKEDNEIAFGLATYSNSQATILSHYSLFEMLWIKANM